MKRCRTASLPGLTRQSILFRKKMDSRVISAFTRVFDALLPAHDETNMLRRRSFLVLIAGAAAWPLAARAQQGERMRRIGVLQGLSESDPEWSRRFGAFKQRLQELGWTEGRNVAFEFRFAGGKPERLPGLVVELVHSAVDVIVTNAAQPIEAARKATSTIPIVMASVGDALGAGYVASLARPGGNVTGLTLVATVTARGRGRLAACRALAAAGESCSNRLPRVQIAHIRRRSLSERFGRTWLD